MKTIILNFCIKFLINFSKKYLLKYVHIDSETLQKLGELIVALLRALSENTQNDMDDKMVDAVERQISTNNGQIVRDTRAETTAKATYKERK